MQKIVISSILSVALGGLAVGGIYLHHRAAEAERATREVAAALSSFEEDLHAAIDEVRGLREEVRRLATAPVPPAGEVAPAPAPAERAAPTTASPTAIRTYVTQALEEERRQRDEERKKQREEFRQKAEARRQAEAALREGPYGRFNLKVNSLANVLSLDDAQKTAYSNLLQASWEKYEGGRQKVAEQGGGDPGGNGKGRRKDNNAARELAAAVQKDFEAALPGILTAPQLEVYGQLPDFSRSFRSLGEITAPGEGPAMGPGRQGGRKGAGRGGR